MNSAQYCTVSAPRCRVHLPICFTQQKLTVESITDETLHWHLAAAMQFCKFQSVVGTMWAMADIDGRTWQGTFTGQFSHW
jgi:hypothetical protein